MSGAQRIDDLLILGERLIALLTKENDALKAMNATAVRALLDDKTALSRAFESRFKALAEAPTALAECPAARRERLKGLCHRLDALGHENARLIKVALAVHDKVIAAVADAVKASQAGPGAYSARGAAQPAARRRKRGAPVSVDQAL